MNELCGARDANLNFIESAFKETDISVRGNEITLDGKNADEAAEVIEELISLVENGHNLDEESLSRVMDIHSAEERANEVLSQEIMLTSRGNPVRPKTIGQKRYIEAIKHNTITFGIGPAGTGKSWLAVAMAVRALKEKEVDRIILTRPAVEAGERLGFLPGDIMAKVDPYLRPLYDAIAEFQTTERMNRLIDNGTLEVAPLAFMRGRTLSHSFVILDEAQNTTPEQMKMFLTRMGFGSKAVITGDVTQVDVPSSRGGLKDLDIILGGVQGLEFVHLTSKDVVRNPIVTQIVNAYEKSH